MGILLFCVVRKMYVATKTSVVSGKMWRWGKDYPSYQLAYNPLMMPFLSINPLMSFMSINPLMSFLPIPIT